MGESTTLSIAGPTPGGRDILTALLRDGARRLLVEAEVAEHILFYAARRAPGSILFPLTDEKGAKMLRVDLKAAGIAYRDGSGLVFDFYALRCQMATNADAAGVTPRVVLKMMRHSTLELTGKYTRPRAVDVEHASAMLPSLGAGRRGPKSSAMKATGTDGPLAHRIASGTDEPTGLINRTTGRTDNA